MCLLSLFHLTPKPGQRVSLGKKSTNFKALNGNPLNLLLNRGVEKTNLNGLNSWNHY